MSSAWATISICPSVLAARTPMQWSTEPQAGFTKGSKPIVPVISEGPYGYLHLNAAVQRRDPNSMLNWTERIIRMRKEVPEIVLLDQGRDGARIPGRLQKREVERQVHALEIASVIGHQFFGREVDFSDQQPGGKFIDHTAQSLHDLVDLGKVGREQRDEALMRGLSFPIGGIWRVVAKSLVLDEMPQNVNAKAVDTPAQPETHDLVHGHAHLRVAPIQVRLLGEECVIIVLSSALIERPGAAAELG